MLSVPLFRPPHPPVRQVHQFNYRDPPHLPNAISKITGNGLRTTELRLCWVDIVVPAMDCVSHRGGCGPLTWVGLRSTGADLNFAEFIFPKMFRVGRVSWVG